MSKCLFLSVLLVFSFSAFARTDDALMREAWTQDLKALLSDIENKHPTMLVENEKRLLERFSLISSAWADSRFNCFYGGWPSVLRISGGKKVCQLPANTNPTYDKGACATGEIQCQPILFNKGQCVSFNTPEERRSSFANCEKKFQEKGGNYDYLDNPSSEDLEQLKEISLVAAEVCGSKSNSPQKNTMICKNIMKKLPDGLKSIQKGISRATGNVEVENVVVDSKASAPVSGSTPVVTPVSETKHTEEDCEEPSHSHKEIADMAISMKKISNSNLDEMYDEMKQNFQSSPFCKPENVMNDPRQQPSGFFVKLLSSDLRGIEFKSESDLDALSDKYQVSSSTRNEVASYISQIKSNSGDAKTLRARMKGVFIQDVLNNRQLDMSPHQEAIKQELAKNNIFTKHSNGEIECPFVSKDAFMKAMAGRDEVLRKFKGNVRLPTQITIVDYSRPSNERRMFVMDVNNLEVLHNTWVAHGVGSNKDGSGGDGIGGGPEMSNASGSLKSSEGFILAGKASYGEKFKNNVILNGIDNNNSNMAARNVIVHGWDSPMDNYSIGIRTYDKRTRTFSTPIDSVGDIKRINFKTASTKQMDEALWNLSDATAVSRFMTPTEGCLGVPESTMKHLDKKGRNLNQLELLRQDLPGSIIFNYSGPDMKSKYF